MEDWIDIIKERLQEAQAPLPPNDWEEFEAASLPAKRTRVLPRLIPALAVAAAAALFVILKPGKESIIEPEPMLATVERVEPDVPVMVAEVVPPETVQKPMARRPAVIPSQVVTEELETQEDPALQEDPAPQDVPEDSEVPVVEQPAPKETLPQEESFWNDTFEPESTSSSKPRGRLALSPRLSGPGSSRAVVQSNTPAHFYFGGDKLSSPGNDYYTSSPPGAYQSWTAHHSLPLSFGLEISYFPAPRLALTSGLELSLFRSTFTTPVQGSASVRQQAYYLGIPLKVDWVALQAGRFSAWLGAGGKVDRCLSIKIDKESFRDNTFNWSVMADVSLQYALTNNLGLYIQPEVSYYFKPSAPALRTYRTEHPLMVTVGAGLRIGF